MRKLIYLSIVLLTLFTTACEEDTIEPDVFGSLFGEVVVEGSSADPIVDARITTNPPSSTVFSDDLGRFAFENIKAATYTVRVEKDGFVTQLETVTINDNKTTNVVIKLQEDSLLNQQPGIPFDPVPENATSDLPVDIELKWSSSDPDEEDVLTYDVILFNSDMTINTTIADGITDTMIMLTELDYNTQYFWQVIVEDGQGGIANGPVWQFSTGPFPDLRYHFARYENDRYDIIGANASGIEIKLTDNGSSNWRPRMSPQRDKIAFISNREVESHIYTMNRDGSDPRKITTIPIAGFNSLELNFCWSPDGEKILYMNNNSLYTVNRDGTGTTLLAMGLNGHTFSECDWTDQGNQILVRLTGDEIYNSTIYLIDEQGNYVRQIFDDAPGNTGGPMFSIDGTKMIYTQDIDGFESASGRRLNSRILIRDLGNQQQTLDVSIEKLLGTNDLDARFAPNGAQVIYVNTNNDGISQKNIYIVDLDGDNRELLFENAEMPDWR